MRALVYQYGCEVPDSPHIQQEIELMRAFRDALVTADQKHHKMEESAMIASMPEYASARANLDSASDALRSIIEARNTDRAKTGAKASVLDQDVTASVEIRNAARTKCWDLAKKWRATNRDAWLDLETQRREAQKMLRKNSGLYWGNYNRALQDFEASRQTCRKKGRKLRYSDLTREAGCLTVQIQRTKTGLGAGPTELMDGSVRDIQIGHIPDGAQDIRSACRRAKACKTKLEMRIDAAGNMLRTNVWMHRRVPDGSRIKAAQLVWRHEGERMVGSLCLTIIAPEVAPKHESRCAAGVNLGWRLNPDGSLRIATSLTSSGRLTHHCLSKEWMEGMNRVDRLCSHIDGGLLGVGEYIRAHPKLPSLFHDALKSWRPGLGARNIDAKALHDAVRTLAGSLMPARRLGGRDVWKQCPLGGMNVETNSSNRSHTRRRWPIDPVIKAWYDRYRHLMLYRDNLRARLLRNRREIYRLLARDLAMEHAILGIEDLNLARLARTKKCDDATVNELRHTAGMQRIRACLHLLGAEIEHQARKHGAQIVYATAMATTRCRSCGTITNQLNPAVLRGTCLHCAAEWDQGANAAGNLLDVAEGIASGNAVRADSNVKSTDCAPKEARWKKRSKKGHDGQESCGPP